MLGDYSDKMAPEVWTELVLDKYLAGECDCMVVELNAGGNLLVHALRAAAKERGMTVTVVKSAERTWAHSKRKRKWLSKPPITNLVIPLFGLVRRFK